MSYGLVEGYFDDAEHADHAVEALSNRKFRPKTTGEPQENSDELCNMTAPHSSDPNKIVVGASLIGALIGALGGFCAMWVQPGFVNLLSLGPLLSAISGAAAGGLIGLMLGAFAFFDETNFDNQTTITSAKVRQRVISLEVENQEELGVAEAIMEERGASEVHIRLTHAPVETPVEKTKELAK